MAHQLQEAILLRWTAFNLMIIMTGLDLNHKSLGVLAMESSNIRHWAHILRTLVIVQLWAHLSRFSLVLWSRITISPDTSWSTKSGYSNDDQCSLNDQTSDLCLVDCLMMITGGSNCMSVVPATGPICQRFRGPNRTSGIMIISSSTETRPE